MNEELKQDGTKRPHEAFTEATGYATVEVALAWAEGSRVLSRDEYEILQGKDGFENCRADRKASIVLAAEVRRLREEAETTGTEYSNLLNLLRHARNGDKDASLNNERMIADAALKCARRNAVKLDAAEATIAALTELLGQRAESHNKPELSDGAKPKEVPNA